MLPHRTPESGALSGFPQSAQARVVATHVNGDYAAVYVVTHATDDRGDWLALMHKGSEGWREVGGGDGGQMWVLCGDTEEDEEGVVVQAHPVERPGTYLVRAGLREATVRVEGSHLVAVLVGVSADEWSSTRTTLISG